MIRSKQLQHKHLVLVVDDYEINRDALGVILEDDYEILYAENGREALALMRQYADTLSIVLLDLMMPVMTGFEVLQTVQEDPQLSEIPVIVLTSEKNAELQALQLGAADFITKPFELTEIILARIERIIELSEGRQLISAAERDKLTGLYSRNFFFEYANRLFQYHPELRMDAVVFNVEQFHSVNALHGREFGNRVLQCIGDELQAFLAEQPGIAGRSEADRFGLYCTGQADYVALLRRLQARIDSLSPTASIQLRMGVKPWEAETEPVVLFDCAQTACNMARGNYKNPIRVYDEALHRQEMRNRRLVNDLRHAVEEGQLEVYYQPKYDIQCVPPRLSSAEALIRWEHPELGKISPGVFIPLFESNGMIGIIDHFVWREAARQIARWRERYGITLPVSVNLSRAEAFDPTVSAQLTQLVAENGLQPRDLRLEITESAFADNARQMLPMISELRALGFAIEMDDFGTGYSSLNMLSDLPFDVLKMDMSFIRNLESNEIDRRLVRLILDLAKNLDVKVVVEGIETEGQLAILREGGCRIGQGYFFSPPLPPEKFAALLEKSLAEERRI